MGYKIQQGDLVKDREELLAFWNEARDSVLDGKFRWMYEDNIDGRADFWVLIHEESRQIVGMSALFPRRFLVDGEVVMGAVAGDLFVAPEHRSMGPAIMLQKAVLKGALERGIAVLVIFSNKGAECIQRRIGYVPAGYLARYVRPIFSNYALVRAGVPVLLSRVLAPVIDGLMKMRFSVGAGRGACIREVERLDQSFDIFWSSISSNFRFIGQRSRAYMNWKYGEDPDDENHFLIYEPSGGRIAACLVYRQDGSVYEIRDLLPGPETTEGGRLLNYFFLMARDAGINRVVMYTVKSSELAKNAEQAGFRETQVSRAVMIFENSGTNDAGVLGDGRGVLIMKSDEDT